MRIVAFALLLALTTPTHASDIRAWREAHEAAIVRELFEFLAIPNVASDEANIRRNAAHLVALMEKRGLAPRLLESPAGGPPAVFGELRTPGATKTLVFYAHYDGQPVNPAEWRGDPWKPELREERIYARSASDDKGPIIALFAALDALRASGRKPAVNLKFFFEGEEEAGSPHLGALLEKHKTLLASDGWIFCDGPVHQSGAMQVVFGVRGAQSVTLTTFGPARQLHSGHYGNWAPNPISTLVTLLGSMRDDDGNIKVANFLDDVRPLTARERDAVAKIPAPDAELRRTLNLGRSEGGGAPLAERILAPALNFTGFQSGSVGGDAVNAIRTEARATIDIRLVPAQTTARVREQIEAHVRKQGFHIVHERPSPEVLRAHERVVQLDWSDGYTGVRTPLDHPFAQAVLRAVEKGHGAAPLATPSLGGSLPLYLFEQILGAPLVIVPTVNSDNNQHAANENLRLQNLWDAIEVYAALFSEIRY
ncbi:MAG TPA: M20/M25/M40 family metallo-hydrolase [Thermoanaerobaculia bacterium]|jgi:acetylornithine deacetylase/succinyl-diaminopimelate desuccinylase-like protein